jgi:hypothetical protein
MCQNLDFWFIIFYYLLSSFLPPIFTFLLNILLSFLIFQFSFLSSFVFTPLLFRSYFIYAFYLMWFHHYPTPTYLRITYLVVVVIYIYGLDNICIVNILPIYIAWIRRPPGVPVPTVMLDGLAIFSLTLFLLSCMFAAWFYVCVAAACLVGRWRFLSCVVGAVSRMCCGLPRSPIEIFYGTLSPRASTCPLVSHAVVCMPPYHCVFFPVSCCDCSWRLLPPTFLTWFSLFLVPRLIVRWLSRR